VEHPAGNLFKLGNQRIRISAGKRRRIYFGKQQVGRCQVPTAPKTRLVRLPWKSHQRGHLTAHTTVTDRSLNALETVYRRDACLGRPRCLVRTTTDYKGREYVPVRNPCRLTTKP
jgi:hypothetical protein